MIVDPIEIISNLKDTLNISIYCLQRKQHYVEAGLMKYWAQCIVRKEPRWRWETPAQIDDELRNDIVSKFQKLLKYANEKRFVDYIHNRFFKIAVDMDKNPLNDIYTVDELKEIRSLFEFIYAADDFRLIVTYNDATIALNPKIEARMGYNPILNDKSVKSQYHYGLSMDFNHESTTPFYKHFYDYQDKYFNVEYCTTNKHNAIIWKTKKVKNIVGFAKRKYGIKNISELKKKSLIGTKLIWGDVRFTEDCCFLRGDAKNIFGDISHIMGSIHPKLSGNVSGLRGYITNLYGNATGVKLSIPHILNEPTSINELISDDCCVEKFHLLSNEDNKTLMKVWNCLAHHTVGITEKERKLFDAPVKKAPPFKVDKWGRHYYKSPNREKLIVVSINPADIMFAKDVNKCSTCFCLNSGNSKWELGMRCLIALDSVNPTLGVAFEIKKDSIKKMNQFNGIKFKWYEPERAEFFQYNAEGIKPFYTYAGLWDGIKSKLMFLDHDVDGIEPIYGHDGIEKGHNRQKTLAYLETFIKDGYRWYRGDNNDFPLVNNYHDFTEEDVKKKGWESDIEIAKKKEQELLAYLKQVKGE